MEVGCGAGQGLGYLATKARTVVGGDVNEYVLKKGRSHYGGRVPLVQLDAHMLPFRGDSFDVVVLFEAIYYLSEPERFISESLRVLRKGGVLAICSVNKEWEDFNPSPFSTKYYSAKELKALLGKSGLEVNCFKAFFALPKTTGEKLKAFVKRSAVATGMIPKTMDGKRLLKRLFLGRLYPLREEIIEGMANFVPAVPVSDGTATSDHKIIYVFARKLRG